ncbi:hypothetical protein VB264_14705 [Arcicella aquatica]|uniref:Restriction endonuclease n=1 Tax=Arcicella aquatica TaxID=217141 RepID=A0ABU5QQN4_9BACT|nr:hypothetical protein [Arcicella aquatica]MEA5259044.1 hypothetical protein [Arcicella aquatica]
MVEKILVREYLSSLKEDGELDYIFVFLLESMGFEIITTPKQSKGQSQYGKDIVALGEVRGVKYCWNFELKGYADKDINSNSFNKDDGIRMSLQEIKDVAYQNKSYPDFDKLQKKIVLVHNGIVKENFKPQFNGFIEQNFEGGVFEDWDIYRLTDLFSEHLFGEYLLADDKNAYAFKRLLMFLDVPDYNFEDLEILFSNIIQEYRTNSNERQRLKMFATLNLLMMIVWSYARQKDNLNSAKHCINYIILNTWEFLLANDFENSQKHKKNYNSLLQTQLLFFDEYFSKTWEVASFKNGLFIPSGLGFENIGYPIRAFEYMDNLVYYYELKNAFMGDNELVNLQKSQKDTLMVFINNNQKGCCKPIFDNHFIPIFNLVDFFLSSVECSQEDVNFIARYIKDCIEQITIRKQIKGIFPYHGYNMDSLIHLEATNEKQKDYPDTSSLLIPYLLEMLAIFSLDELYDEYNKFLEKELSFQTAIPNFEGYPDFEQRFFKGHLHNEYNIEFSVKLPSTLQEYKESLNKKKAKKVLFRTEKAGYGFLMTLARSFYKNEPFPDDWRCWLGE